MVCLNAEDGDGDGDGEGHGDGDGGRGVGWEGNGSETRFEDEESNMRWNKVGGGGRQKNRSAKIFLKNSKNPSAFTHTFI